MNANPIPEEAIRGLPVIYLPPSVMVTEVHLDPIPGRPYPQPMTPYVAEARGFIHVIQSGHDTAVAIASSRVRLILRLKH